MKTTSQKKKRSKARARDSFTKRVGRFKFRKITHSDKSSPVRYYFIFEGKTGKYVGDKKTPSSHVYWDFFLTFDKRQAQPFGFLSAIAFIEAQSANKSRGWGCKPAFRIERVKF
jgi:hypothetical protein